MMLRRQLPVYSPIRASVLASAAASAWKNGKIHHEFLAAHLTQSLSARRALLTDSGTSALILALRILVGRGGTVALPAYACVDLVAAARYADVRVRPYDVDPATLSPDLDSLSRALKQGVAAVVVAHLYGYPADVPAVAALALTHGASVIEDAAQGAGGMLRGRPLGSFGALTVLSFGRGKGITGGHGGALLAITPELAERLESIDGGGPMPAGWRDVAVATAQWALGRPTFYSIPAAIPGLRLGEMVFHPADEPRAMSSAAAAMVRAALTTAEQELGVRRQNAAALISAVVDTHGWAAIEPVAGSVPGYLRFPVRDFGHRAQAPSLGIMRGYPRTLPEEPELRESLEPNEESLAGAAELRRSLFTLPVHSRVTRRDLRRLAMWLRSPEPSALTETGIRS
jgi:dTDP-4-amino-4,6-dideoxygalactose transaminase